MSLFSREITAVRSTSQQLVTDISVENKTTQQQQVLALVTPKPNTEEMALSTRGSPSVDYQVKLILERHDKEETISESEYGSVTQKKESKPVTFNQKKNAAADRKASGSAIPEPNIAESTLSTNGSSNPVASQFQKEEIAD